MPREAPGYIASSHMNTHSPQVPAVIPTAVRRLFPADQVEAVIAQLLRSAQFAPSGEWIRVQLAVLKLYEEDPARGLEAWINSAAADYRDVLFWAESPGQSAAGARRTMSAVELKKTRKLDHEQYATWLRKNGA
jgi:hypothetical protein